MPLVDKADLDEYSMVTGAVAAVGGHFEQEDLNGSPVTCTLYPELGTTTTNMTSIGIVLSGGGARCFGHLGLLQVLEELSIKPSAISGVSGGALIGALYAAGKTPTEILALSKTGSYLGLSNLIWKRGGFFSMESMQHLLAENIPHNSFEGLKIRLFVNATDFNQNRTVFFTTGKLLDCLTASASVPIIFNPVEMDDSLLVDGGLLNNLPVEPLISLCTTIIGSHVNRLATIKPGDAPLSNVAILERCFHMSIASTVYSRGLQCHLLLEPQLDSFGLFDLRAAPAIFEIGYRNALQHKDRILELVS